MSSVTEVMIAEVVLNTVSVLSSTLLTFRSKF